MVIQLVKFGVMLNSRPSGKEALAAFRPVLREVSPEEPVTVDFSGVVTFSPSWGDEFLSPLLSEFGDRLLLLRSDNPSVTATLEVLEKSTGRKFPIRG